MTNTAKLELPGGKTVELPVVIGTENEPSIDISKLRADTGYVTLDDGYGNTGSCVSNITFIDGDAGILRYRGYAIEDLAAQSSFIEAAQLLIWGELPTKTDRDRFGQMLGQNAALPEPMRRHFSSFPPAAHPMAVLSAMINTLQAYDLPHLQIHNEDDFEVAAASLISKVRTIAAASYKASIDEPLVYPRPDLKYAENFLHMMFSRPYKDYVPSSEVAHALNMMLVLHADHEQNCSTSTVRMVASSQANLYASAAAGVCALWGPLHGGANQAVIEMLEQIEAEGISVKDYVAKVKDKTTGVKLMGFGHRVYRNFDPRAAIIKKAADDLLDKMHIDDPKLELARELEAAALSDDYFVERKLYPNVDFYSGIILKAVGIPINMFTVMFAIGRMPGWIANWKEIHDNPAQRIYRPRQIYTGPTPREFVARKDRQQGIRH
ncbi:MAG: citrate synthase [Propionibacteriaceae bacterium]